MKELERISREILKFMRDRIPLEDLNALFSKIVEYEHETKTIKEILFTKSDYLNEEDSNDEDKEEWCIPHPAGLFFFLSAYLETFKRFELLHAAWSYIKQMLFAFDEAEFDGIYKFLREVVLQDPEIRNILTAIEDSFLNSRDIQGGEIRTRKLIDVNIVNVLVYVKYIKLMVSWVHVE